MVPFMAQTPGEVPTHSRQTAALPEVYVQDSSLEIAWTRIVARRRDRRRDGRPVLDRGLRGPLDRLSRRARGRPPAGRREPRPAPGDRPDGSRHLRRQRADRADLRPARRAGADPRARGPGDPRRGVRRREPDQRALEHHGGGLGAHRHVVQRRRHPRLAAPRGAGGRRRLLLLQGPRRAGRLRRAGGRRQARLRPAAPAAQGRRAARPPGHPRHAAGVHEHRLARDGRLARPRASPAPRGWTAARRRVFVITGDGELQEGQFWESLGQAANEGFGEITAIVDHNKIQSDTWVEHVSRPRRPRGQGPRVRLGGRALRRQRHGGALEHADRAARAQREPPQAADRRHGQGRGRGRSSPRTRWSSRGTALYAYHSGAPSARTSTAIAIAELVCTAGRAARPRSRSCWRARPRAASPPATPQKLVDAYGSALLAAGDRRADLVALDADLYLDCGLIPFRGAHPGPLRRVRDRRDGHGLPGRRAGPGRQAARSCTRSPASSRRARASRSTTTPPRARRSSTAASWPGSSPAARATRTSRSATSR